MNKKLLWILPLMFLLLLSMVSAAIDWETDAYTYIPLADYNESTGLENIGTSGSSWDAVSVGLGAALNGEGTAFEFDGTDDTIRLGSGDYDLVGSAGSLSFWFNSDSDPDSTTDQRLVFQNYFLCEFNNNFQCRIYDQGGSSFRDLAYTSGLSADTWTHVVVTWNTNDVVLYIDGSSGATSSTFTLQTGDYAFYAGSGAHVNKFFDGEMSDFIHFNKELSSTEVSNLYSKGRNYNPYEASDEEVLTTEITSVYLSPNSTVYGDESSLNGVAVLNQTSGIYLNYTYYVNGVATTTGQDTTPSSTTNLPTFAAANFEHFDNVSVGVIAVNSSNQSQRLSLPVNSSILTISNKAPTVEASFSTYSASNSTDIIAYCTIDDDDADSLNITWNITNQTGLKVNGTLTGQSNGQKTVYTLYGNSTQVGENLTLNCLVNDSYATDSGTSEELSIIGITNFSITAIDAWSSIPLTDFTAYFNFNFSDYSFYCYQESANESNQTGIDGNCNLNYGGNYINNMVNYPYKIVDGNWGTYGFNAGVSNDLFINYSIPDLAIGALWVSKDEDSTMNMSIPSSCFNYDSNFLKLKLIGYDTLTGSEYYCYNGEWYNFINRTGWLFYEEAIYWLIQTNQTINSLSSTNGSLITPFDFSTRISYWPLSSNASDVWRSKDGTVTNVTFVNNSAYFDGESNKSIILDSFPFFDSDNIEELSFSVWINKTGVSQTSTQGIFVKDAHVYFTIFNDYFRFIIRNEDNNGYETIDSNTPIASNEWVHLAATFNNGERRIYVNGELSKNSSSYEGGIYGTGAQKVNIGATKNPDVGYDRFFNGSIKEVKLYERALTSSEIQDLYLTGTEIPERINITIVADDYFNKTYNNYDWSNNLQAEPYQTIINFSAYEFITNNTLNETIFTISGQTLEQFNLSEGSYTVNASKNGYYDRLTIFNVTPLQISTLNITLYDTQLTINPFEKLSGSTVSDFTIRIHNENYSFTRNYSTTSNTITINLTTLNNYNITFIKDEYIQTSFSYNLTSSTHEINITVYPTNDIRINFFDEETLEPITNVTVDLYGSIYSANFTTTTNTYLLENLPNDIYRVHYGLNDEVYKQRNYHAVIPHRDEDVVNSSFYLLNESEGTLFVRTIVDQGNIPVNGYLEIQRPYTNTGEGFIYRSIEFVSIDSQGDAVFFAIPNDQQYRFRVYNSSFHLINIQSPSFLTSTNSQIVVDEDSDIMDNFNQATGTQTNLRYQASSDSFVLDYVSLNTIDGCCLEVTYALGTNRTTQKLCSAAASGTITLLANMNTINGTWTAYAIAQVGDQTYYIDEDYEENVFPDNKETLKYVGPFLLCLVIILCIGMSFTTDPVYPIALATFSLAAFGLSFLGLVTFSVALLGGLNVLSIIVLLLARNK
jgi:hypothetical protein